MTIDDYIDLAMANGNFASDRELGRALGFKGNPVNHWRTKRAWPADPTMIALAKLAGVDPIWALVELNIWRAQTSAVRNEYAALLRLVEKARGAAAAILVAASALTALAAAGPDDIGAGQMEIRAEHCPSAEGGIRLSGRTCPAA